MSYIAALYERTKYWNLNLITTGNNTFYNYSASGILIILENAKMVANGKVNCVMSPYVRLGTNMIKFIRTCQADL